MVRCLFASCSIGRITYLIVLHTSALTCSHELGDTKAMWDCVQSCWHPIMQTTKPDSKDDAAIVNQSTWEQLIYDIHDAVLHAMASLEFTGATGDEFHAFWPFADAPGLYTLPISRQEHTWISILANTRHTSCFAVMSLRCLEFHYEDERGSLARLCTGRGDQQKPCDGHLTGRIASSTKRFLKHIGLVNDNPQDCYGEIDSGCRQCVKTTKQQQASASSRGNQSAFLRTYIHLNPQTPAHLTKHKNELGHVLLEEGAHISLGQLGTLEIIRNRGMHIANLHSSKINSTSRDIFGKVRVHKELLDPEKHSSNVVEIHVWGGRPCH